MQTTAGSLALQGSIAAHDAFIVEKLRAAGAVILGKTNLSEWANFRSTPSISGWSSRGGQTRNPYALDRTPWGSSSGSAVAVAADLCAVAVGTETDGSITYPASINSIVGIKPTLGLVSRRGIIPIAHSQDTAGPLARSVADAALLLGIMAGVDAQDSATGTGHSTGKALSDYTGFLDVDGLRGARIGVAGNYLGFHARVDQLLSASLDIMRACGAEIIVPVPLAGLDELRAAETEVLYYEFKADLNAYLNQLDPAIPVRSMADVIAFNDARHDSVLRYFGQERMLLAQAKGSLDDPQYQHALQTSRRLAGAEGIDAVLREHRLDAIVAPTTGLPWLIDAVNGDYRSGGCATPAAAAGYPHITVPMGYAFGLPAGLSLFAGAWQEGVLIRLAYAYEQASRLRRPPQFSATADLNR
jgi:amidase